MTTISVTGSLPPVTRASSYEFSVQLAAGTNITSDRVTFTLKELPYPKNTDALAALQVNADVVTSGATGLAIFSLTPTQLDIPQGKYPYDIIWYPVTGGEYRVSPQGGQLQILERVSDP
jgi:hypothetical protein